MAAFASGGSASRDAAADRLLRLRKGVELELELECGDISSSQEDLLARAPFLGGAGGGAGDQATATRPNPKPRKPRVCTRKVRGARTTTTHPPNRSIVVDPLYMAVLMIPTAPPPPTAGHGDDVLMLARSRGIF